jgi:hypothetical protein
MHLLIFWLNLQFSLTFKHLRFCSQTITYILRQIGEDVNQFQWKKIPNKEKEIECQTNQTVF